MPTYSVRLRLAIMYGLLGYGLLLMVKRRCAPTARVAWSMVMEAWGELLIWRLAE
jgi:hypothetical protein